MKTIDLTYDNIKYLALKYPVSRPEHTNVAIDSGKWLAYPAGNEEVKRLTKKAKEDIFQRKLRGTSYEGDLGKVVVGGKIFFLYPKSKALVRKDFADWMDANADKFLTKDGQEKKSNKPLHVEEVKPVPQGRFYLEVKDRVKRMPKATRMIFDTAYNSSYEFEKTKTALVAECQEDWKHNEWCAATHLKANFIAAVVEYRNRNYAKAVDIFLDVAANAIQAAEFICSNHSRETK